MQFLLQHSGPPLPVLLCSFKAVPMEMSMPKAKGLHTQALGGTWELQAASGPPQLGTPFDFAFFLQKDFAYFNIRCHPLNFLIQDETFQLNIQLTSS